MPRHEASDLIGPHTDEFMPDWLLRYLEVEDYLGSLALPLGTNDLQETIMPFCVTKLQRAFNTAAHVNVGLSLASAASESVDAANPPIKGYEGLAIFAGIMVTTSPLFEHETPQQNRPHFYVKLQTLDADNGPLLALVTPSEQVFDLNFGHILAYN